MPTGFLQRRILVWQLGLAWPALRAAHLGSLYQPLVNSTVAHSLAASEDVTKHEKVL